MNKIAYILLSMFLPLSLVAQDVTNNIDNQQPLHTEITYSKAFADSAYVNADYSTAITAYEYIIANKGEAPELYYNLGNAYYKSNQIAKAILNYERALLLSPSDEDVLFNLELAQSKIVDNVSEQYKIFFTEWIEAMINMFGMTSWSIIAITSFVLLLVALLMLFFSNNVSIRRAGFFTAIIMLCVTVFSNLAAYSHYNKQTDRVEAVIMLPSVTAKSTPDNSGTNLFVLHEGRKVKISDDSIKGWKEIELEDGNVGWVPATAIERI